MSAVIHVGDALEVLRAAPSGLARCCVTSPPYWGLRDYGIEGQLGLEPTPEEYVSRLVEVFREVRRVLADDGTLWLNMGDSYTSGGRDSRNPGQSKINGGGRVEGLREKGTRAPTPGGLKSKDLIGIPWRVAFALQQPYYTGRIKRAEDRIWLAAMLDAEGCLFIHKRKAGQHNGQGYYRQNDNFGPGVEISNTSPAVVERIAAITGLGSVCSQGPEENRRRRQTIYRWNLRTTECREFVRELYPHLVAKQQQARILIGCPSSGERAEAAHAALIALHRTGASDVDFPPPASLFEPGYYLRSDIVWSKANPMPESVRDRPTKAHEYVFLLSKRASYYYDAEAIKEGGTGRDPGNITHKGTAAYEAGDEHHRTKGGLLAIGARTSRNRRSVWTVTTQPYPEAHFATFPPALVEPCILAGSAPGDTVLDPFAGAGTTGLVARRLGRNFVGIELNPTYAEMAQRRIRDDAPLLNEVRVEA